ncbi:aquaporin-like protein [Testicularia cyperi]|uniref:Aquaporin-like protein n=1 Tax=Testicularia cyperi TaxID=1882483 RepID=A0A317XMI3_9BASI|nr:aquaporin-like protein [Testicularia cyperi]
MSARQDSLNMTNPTVPAAGTGVYSEAKTSSHAGPGTAATAVNDAHVASSEHQGGHQAGGLYTAPTGAPVPNTDRPLQQMVAQPSIFSIGSGGAEQAAEQPTLLERRESLVMEEQLPAFMKIDESDHKHRHHYRAALKRRLELKNNLVAFVSEFVGTVLFLFFSFGIATQATNARAANQDNGGSTSLSQNAPPDTSALLYSSLGFGFSLAVNAWTFYRVSGGLFNPAVTLALFLTGTLNWFQLFHLTVAQLAGGIAAAALCDGIIPGTVNARTTLANGITVAQGFWLEFFLTAQLLFAIFMLAAEKHRGTFLAPVGIGLALFIAELFGTNYTGGSLNPARTLGPDVIAGRFESYHWIYWIAPYGAALVTAAFYQFLKYFQYESVNIGQDADESKQVFRDAYGNVMGVLEFMPASDFAFQKVKPQPEENEGERTRDGTVINSSSDHNGLTAAGLVKRSREEKEAAHTNKEVPNGVA